MKITWGTGIYIFLILFLIACGIFIAFALNQNLNLVHEEYYEKGANYSEQMEIDKRSEKFQNLIYLQESETDVLIYFPDNFNENLKSGEIHFYRASDANNDLMLKMEAKSGVQRVDKKNLVKGRYLVKLRWNSDMEYYLQKEIFVNK